MTNVAVDLVHTDDERDERRRRRSRELREAFGALLFLAALFTIVSAKPAENIGGQTPSTNTNVVTPPAVRATPIAVNPASFDFGAMNVGTSKTQPITFMNPGTSEFVTSAIASGLAPTDFTIAADQCARIAPSEMCTAIVAFAPRSAGAQSATFTLRSESNTSLPVNVTGSGLALAGLLAFAQPEIALGSHRIGVASRQPFTIENRGNTSLTVTGIASSDPQQFEAVGCVNTAIVPGTPCEGFVVFRPQSRGKIDATLSASDDTGKTATVALTGGGILHMLNTTTPQVDVPREQGKVVTATFANTGDDNVTISGPAQVTRGYIITADGCAKRSELKPSETCDVNLYARGDVTAANVKLSGDGVEATAALTPIRVFDNNTILKPAQTFRQQLKKKTTTLPVIR
ncbi:MAG TPA: choice-of-anchor D domain-containing protein [Thermoanaerobaculia bacterium]|nr:choice-of-anchor D domain-containing protein [Thermoanaerobaculia bacterium]